MLEVDARLFRWFYEGPLAHGHGWLMLMAALTVLGNGWSMLAILPFVGWRRTRRASAALLTVLLGTSLAVVLLKQWVRRPRPCTSLAGVHALVFAAPSDFSFPSGHAAGSFAFASFLAVLLLRRARIVERGRQVGRSRAPRESAVVVGCFALAAGVAVSRVALGVHFPSDVFAGALVGSLMGAAAATWWAGSARSLASPGSPTSPASLASPADESPQSHVSTEADSRWTELP